MLKRLRHLLIHLRLLSRSHSIRLQPETKAGPSCFTRGSAIPYKPVGRRLPKGPCLVAARLAKGWGGGVPGFLVFENQQRGSGEIGAEDREIELFDAGRSGPLALVNLSSGLSRIYLDLAEPCDSLPLESLEIKEVGYLQILALALKSNPSALSEILKAWRDEGLYGAKTTLYRLMVGPDSQARWITTYSVLTDKDRAAIERHIEGLKSKPMISVLMPTYNSDPDYLRAAVGSVQKQLYPHWELCIADDASTNASITKLLSDLSQEDERIKVVFRSENGHISAASNSALELASGAFVALLDHDDLLAEEALYLVAAKLNEAPETEVLYSDEDRIDRNGRRFNPYFKTGPQEMLLFGQNMVSHLGVFKRSLLRDIGGFRLGYEGSQDYDLALRAIAQCGWDKVAHLPYLLYHWRVFRSSGSVSQAQQGRTLDSARRALSDYWQARYEITASFGPAKIYDSFHRRCEERRATTPSVSLIIADASPDQADHITQRLFLEGVQNSIDLHFVEKEDGKQVRRCSAIAKATQRAKGDVLVFLSAKLRARNPDWLTNLLLALDHPEVALAGGLIEDSQGGLLHGGFVCGINGFIASPFQGVKADRTFYLGWLALARQVSAVSGAAMAVKRAALFEVGGYDGQSFQAALADLDLAFKLNEAGYAVVWDPNAAFCLEEGGGLEEPSEAPEASRAEFIRRWGHCLKEDPYYSPNLALIGRRFALARPPRRAHPWDPFKTAQ